MPKKAEPKLKKGEKFYWAWDPTSNRAIKTPIPVPPQKLGQPVLTTKGYQYPQNAIGLGKPSAAKSKDDLTKLTWIEKEDFKAARTAYDNAVRDLEAGRDELGNPLTEEEIARRKNIAQNAMIVMDRLRQKGKPQKAEKAPIDWRRYLTEEELGFVPHGGAGGGF